MTVTFTISEGPIGICYILEGTLPKRSVFRYVLEKLLKMLGIWNFRDINYDLMDAFTIFVAINASVHFLICLGVHSQYRKSAKELLFCERIYKNLKTSRISVSWTFIGKFQKCKFFTSQKIENGLKISAFSRKI